MQQPADADSRILIDEIEAAEKLGLSPKTLYNMRRAGQLPFVRARGRIMYRVASLEKWAEQQERVATA